MGPSSIEWTDRSWNPVTGCTEVSPGCDHCYARTFAERWRGTRGHPYEQGFDLKLWPERLEAPLKWKRPSKIFVNSMSDLFHKDVPDEFIFRAFEVMNRADWHIFQILTKRPSRAALMGYKLPWSENIWLGTSIESNDYVWRADKIRNIPVGIRFVSAEPLLGPIPDLNLKGISWLIAGAESGHGARQMNEDWVRGLRDKCLESGIAFFYKQNAVRGKKQPLPYLDGQQWIEYPYLTA